MGDEVLAAKGSIPRKRVLPLVGIGLVVLVAAAGTAWLAWERTAGGEAPGPSHSGSAPLPGREVRTPSQPLSTPTTSASDLLKQAETLRAERRFREAEILLARALKSDTNNVAVCRALAAVQREMALASIKAGNLLSAAQEADRAKTTVHLILGISVDPSTPSLDPKIVLNEEDANTKVVTAVREAIDAACEKAISDASELAKEAYHSGWNVLAVGFRPVKNDRDKVVEGLVKLRAVFELGPWASDATRMSANGAYSNLKKLVYPDEWNDLLARAGFDPTSRDTLKKWGLE